MDILPREIRDYLFCFLAVGDVCGGVARTRRAWRTLADDELFWEAYCRGRMGWEGYEEQRAFFRWKDWARAKAASVAIVSELLCRTEAYPGKMFHRALPLACASRNGSKLYAVWGEEWCQNKGATTDQIERFLLPYGPRDLGRYRTNVDGWLNRDQWVAMVKDAVCVFDATVESDLYQHRGSLRGVPMYMPAGRAETVSALTDTLRRRYGQRVVLSDTLALLYEEAVVAAIPGQRKKQTAERARQRELRPQKRKRDRSGGPPARSEIKIQELITSGAIGRCVDLGRFHDRARTQTVYDPLKLPCLIVKQPSPGNANIKVMLFAKGKVVCMGSGQIEDHRERLREIEEEIEWAGCWGEGAIETMDSDSE